MTSRTGLNKHRDVVSFGQLTAQVKLKKLYVKCGAKYV